MPFDPNPLFFEMCSIFAEHKKTGNLTEIYNEGGTRSSKTWDINHMIYAICDHNRGKELEIYILRDTLTNCKDFTLKEFKKCMKVIGANLNYASEGHKPYVNLFGNHIYFRGMPEEGDEAYPSDILYFNEMLEMKKKEANDLIMRCNLLVLGDWNPKYTKHWTFEKEGRPNVFFTRSNYTNNKHLPVSVRRTIESYEPWLPRSYQVDNGIIMYEGEPVDDKNQPPPHPVNTATINEDGQDIKPTADFYQWKVYGLGLRGAMEGLVFPHHTAIDEFPKLDWILGNDFGFTSSPNALVKFAQDGNKEKGINLYVELLFYDPCDDPDELVAVLESYDIPKLKPCIADSSDRFVKGDKGVVLMVKAIREAGYSWRKVKKTDDVMFWLGQMKKCKIHIVKNKFYNFAKTEAENYRMKTVHGFEINQPEDEHNHFWDAFRYAFMGYNNNTKIWG